MPRGIEDDVPLERQASAWAKKKSELLQVKMVDGGHFNGALKVGVPGCARTVAAVALAFLGMRDLPRGRL